MTEVEVNAEQFELFRSTLQVLRDANALHSMKSTKIVADVRFQLSSINTNILCYTLAVKEPVNSNSPQFIGCFRVEGGKVVFHPDPNRTESKHSAVRALEQVTRLLYTLTINAEAPEDVSKRQTASKRRIIRDFDPELTIEMLGKTTHTRDELIKQRDEYIYSNDNLSRENTKLHAQNKDSRETIGRLRDDNGLLRADVSYLRKVLEQVSESIVGIRSNSMNKPEQVDTGKIHCLARYTVETIKKALERTNA